MSHDRSDSPALPLAGVRVLDLSRYLAGPMAGHLLGELGAQVIKVEPPGGDPSRRGSGLTPGDPPNAQFLAVHRNQFGMILNLRTSAGLEVLRELASIADVVIENFRPGVTAALGIDWEALSAVNRRLIYCSISGYGSSGPQRDLAAVDGTIQAASGLLSLSAGREVWPIHIADLTAGLFATQAILAALYRRSVSETGCQIDLSMLESLLQMMPMQVHSHLASTPEAPLMDPAHRRVTVLDLECAGGERLLVQLPLPGVAEQFRQLVAEAADCRALISDSRFSTDAGRAGAADQYLALIRAAFITRTRSEWSDRLARVGVPNGAVNSLAEALSNPQLQARGVIRQTPINGVATAVLGGPFRFDGRRRLAQDRPPPVLGQDTELILATVLGKSARSMAALRAAGAFS